MPLSRIRLRLTAAFAIAFLGGLVVLDLSLYGYLRHRASAQLTARLDTAAHDLALAVRREDRENGATTLATAAHDALVEWPEGSTVFLIRNADGATLATRGDTAVVAQLLTLPARTSRVTGVPGPRVARWRAFTFTDSATPTFTILAATSMAPLHEEDESLREWLLVSAPLVLLTALVAGYLLSRLALAPVQELEQGVAAIPADDLGRRLPLRVPPDELDRLASQFNALLDRVQVVQAQNRRFLETAAHQLRTPLTLVLGESQLSLDRPRTAEEHRDALRRIQLAASQMRARVGDLFLLARAHAGDRPTLVAGVELDGLALEAADLFRGRAQALGRPLELGVVEGVAVRGDPMLLREAVIELLENAGRHAEGPGPIRLEVIDSTSSAAIAVTSPGAPIDLEAADETPEGEPRGLGLALVRWIADVHGGHLSIDRIGGANRVALELPSTGPTP